MSPLLRVLSLLGVVCFASSAFAIMTFDVVPAHPRYLEPVYARIVQEPFPTRIIRGAYVSMGGTEIRIQLNASPDLGQPTFDVMLGRFPAGNYTVTLETEIGPVTREFAVAPSVAGAPNFATTPALNYTDLWWNPAEPGWGMSITHGPTNEVFAVWYVYDLLGNPTWYTLQPGQWDTPTTYSGVIYRTSAAPVSVPFAPSAVSAVRVGTGVLSFNTASSGRFYYFIDGMSGAKDIQRQLIE